MSRPLIADTTGLGVADIALLEIVEGKMSWDLPELAEVDKPANNSKRRKKH